uniref:Uncharacterized protein n=1 Tax=Romanomermis culicivorax TaxID=13658 RepID=A0A915KW64_ROMCU
MFKTLAYCNTNFTGCQMLRVFAIFAVFGPPWRFFRGLLDASFRRVQPSFNKNNLDLGSKFHLKQKLFLEYKYLSYNTPNEYIETMKYCLDLETTENNNMLPESIVHHNHKIELTLLEKSESTDNWIETDVHCKGVLLNVTDTAINGLNFRLCNLQRFNKPKDNMQTWYRGRDETEIETNKMMTMMMPITMNFRSLP